MNHRVQPFFAVLIALGAFGFIYATVTNPGQMISRAITVIIAGIIIYFIVRTVLNRRTGRDGTAFRKAARQSRLRMKEQKSEAPRRTQRPGQPFAERAERRADRSR